MPIKKLLRQNDELSKFVFERETELKLFNVAMVSGLNVLLVGNPGGGKTYAANLKMMYLKDGKKFYRNFTSFTKPEEITGTMNLLKLKEGILEIKSENYLPCAHASILDEASRGQSVKDALLPLVNEGMFVSDGMILKRPFKIMDVFLANHEFTNPDDEALDDRCHLRHFVQRATQKSTWDSLLDLKKRDFLPSEENMVTIAELQELRKACLGMEIPQDVKDAQFEIMKRLEIEEKIFVSERTYREAAAAVCADTMLNEQDRPTVENLSILTHIFAVRKVNYSQVKKIVNAVSNAELERLEQLFDVADKLYEEWSNDKQADSRSFANKMKQIIGDFNKNTPSKANMRFHTECSEALKKYHHEMLEKAKKELAKLSL